MINVILGTLLFIGVVVGSLIIVIGGILLIAAICLAVASPLILIVWLITQALI
jgi:hypothetical protein